MEAVIVGQISIVFNKIFDFQGTATRKEYWTFYFLYSVLLIIALEIDDYLGVAVFFNLVGLCLLLPLIACGARRMHDIDKSGWHQFIPVYNLYLLIKPSAESLKLKEEARQNNRIKQATVTEEKLKKKAKNIDEHIAKEKIDEEKRIKRIIDEDISYKKMIAKNVKSEVAEDAEIQVKTNEASVLKNAFKNAKKYLDEKDAERLRAMAAIICPFCQTKGTVTTKNKQDTSGLKMTGAFFTFGLSTMVTGLNKHQTRIEARCSQCKTTWDMAVNKW
jgi:uncharacterized membrane protein YhaH (DUF805 family)